MAVAKKSHRKKSRTAPKSRRRSAKPRSLRWPGKTPKNGKWISLSKDWRTVVYYFDGKPESAYLQHKPCARGKQRAAAARVAAGYDFGCYYCGAKPKIRRPSRKQMVIEGKSFRRRRVA